MRTIWHSLLWKEWHEHKWKMLALVAIAIGVPLGALYDGSETFFLTSILTLIASTFLSSLFIGMGAAAGENANKTMPFLQALPVPMWKAAAAKLVWASISVVTPILAVVGLAFLWYQVGDWLGYDFKRELALGTIDGIYSPWGLDGWSALRLAGGILSALSLLMWVVASGVNRQDEIRAGAIGVLVFACVWFLIAYVGAWSDPSGMPGPWFEITAVCAPAGPALVGLVRSQNGGLNFFPIWILALTACVSHAGLVLWFLLRYGRTPGVSRVSQRATIVPGQQTLELAPPRRSPLTAVLWKQMRETGHFVMLGVAAIVGCSTLIFLLPKHPQPGGEFGNILLVMCGYLGFFIVIVAGIGVLLDDLKPGLHTFWRSRPINPDLWFWVKFITGLATTLFGLGIPLLLAWSFMVGSTWHYDREPLIIIPALFLSTYCFAVVAMALVRRPIYAAIFAIGLITVSFFSIEHLLPKSFEFEFETVMVMALILSTLATITAWLAVRYDIGYKG